MAPAPAAAVGGNDEIPGVLIALFTPSVISGAVPVQEGTPAGQVARCVAPEVLSKLSPAGATCAVVEPAEICSHIGGRLTEVVTKMTALDANGAALLASQAEPEPAVHLTKEEITIVRRCLKVAKYFMSNQPLHMLDPPPGTIHSCHGAIHLCDETRRLTTGLERLLMTQMMFIFTTCARFHPLASTGDSAASSLGPLGRETYTPHILAVRDFLFGMSGAQEDKARTVVRKKDAAAALAALSAADGAAWRALTGGGAEAGDGVPAAAAADAAVICRVCETSIDLGQLEAHTAACVASAGGTARVARAICLEDFEILKPVSRGSFGKVYLARKRTTGDYFALKVMSGASLTRVNDLDNELAVLASASVGGRYIVRLYYSFTDAASGSFCMAMDWCNGGDLFSLMGAAGALEVDVVRIYTSELVLALEHLHRVGIVHRDIKPANILVGSDGHLRMADFGLSSMGLKELADGTVMACSGQAPPGADSAAAESGSGGGGGDREVRVVGTPEYIAPEVLLGQSHGPAVDWWALGVTLFEMLCGFAPFGARTIDEVFVNILMAELPWPADDTSIPKEARDFVSALLHPEPSLRLGSKGVDEVKTHPFMAGIDWAAVEALEAKPAFTPEGDRTDTWAFTAAQARRSMNDSLFMMTSWLQAAAGPPGPKGGLSGRPSESSDRGSSSLKLAGSESPTASTSGTGQGRRALAGAMGDLSLSGPGAGTASSGGSAPLSLGSASRSATAVGSGSESGLSSAKGSISLSASGPSSRFSSQSDSIGSVANSRTSIGSASSSGSSVRHEKQLSEGFNMEIVRLYKRALAAQQAQQASGPGPAAAPASQ